jgi:hypothetical protein
LGAKAAVTYRAPKKRHQQKLSKKRSKMSYIDEIFRKGSRKKYPQPSPASYFLSKRSLSKLDGEKAELFKSIVKKKILEKRPGPSIRAKRNFCLVANYEEKKKQPGPASYKPYKAEEDKQAKVKNATGYDDFKRNFKAQILRTQELNSKIREKREDVLDKIKTSVPKYPEPLPLDT